MADHDVVARHSAEPLIAISIRRIDASLQRFKHAGKRGPKNDRRIVLRSKQQVVEDLLDQLAQFCPQVFARNADKKRWHEAVHRDRVVFLTREQVRRVAEIVYGELPLHDQKVHEEWSRPSTEIRVLPSGDRKRGEIEISRERKPEDNLIRPEHAPVDKYVQVFVDDVVFRQRQRDGSVKEAPGRYVSIEIPKNQPGAVVLPVEMETGDVLLVTQYRHPQRAWITEAPRGFGESAFDQDGRAAARRELEEETGAKIVTGRREELYWLGSFYTDTGKLLDRPGYFLALVHRELSMERLDKLGPAMENPVWVRLGKFLEAVFARQPIEVTEGTASGEGDFAYVFDGDVRDRFFASTQLEGASVDGTEVDGQPRLHIQDAFTVTAALLALPILAARFGGRPELRGSFDLSRYARE